MAARHRLRMIFGGILVALSGSVVFAGAASACEPAGIVDVQTDSDACASVVAVSVTGDATTECGPLPINNGCVAVSGTGNASNNLTGFSCGSSIGASAGCIAISGTGDASNSVAHGDATPPRNCGYAGVGVFVGCIAISGTGSASNSVEGACGSATTAAIGIGCIAVSGLGNASNSVGPGNMCGDGTVAALGLGCVAVSGGGDASNTSSSSQTTQGRCATGTLGVGVGCIAVSGQGSASNSAAHCADGAVLDGSISVGCIARGSGTSFGSRLRAGLHVFSSGLRLASGVWSFF